MEEAENICFYVSKEKENEVKTKEMIKNCLNEDKNILVPFVDGKELKITDINSLESDLEKGKFGILEPKESEKEETELEKVNLIIIPGLAFDTKGNRLGYGKGYYDGLLSRARGETDFIGLAYELQMVEKVPNDSGDVPIPKIVTERRTISNQKNETDN